MEKQETKVENNEVVNTEKRKAGKSATLSSFKTLVINLEGLGLVNEKDWNTLKEMYNKAKKQYMGDELL